MKEGWFDISGGNPCQRKLHYVIRTEKGMKPGNYDESLCGQHMFIRFSKDQSRADNPDKCCKVCLKKLEKIRMNNEP